MDKRLNYWQRIVVIHVNSNKLTNDTFNKATNWLKEKEEKERGLSYYTTWIGQLKQKS